MRESSDWSASPNKPAVSDAYLAATVNEAAVAKHHGLKAFINTSQMTLSQMSITETFASPQHKLHWLAEQALNWSGLPVVKIVWSHDPETRAVVEEIIRYL